MRKLRATEELTDTELSGREQCLGGQAPREARALYPRAGVGSAIAHHGEILQGALGEIEGRPCYGLVSLRCNIFSSEATFSPDDAGTVIVEPDWKVKARRAVELTLAQFGETRRGGRLTIRSDIPPRWGLGSSTSDVTAAIRAIASAYGRSVPAEVIAELSVEAELASDSTMFDERAVLFACREGFVIEDFGGPLPPLEVLGFNTDATGAGVDTLNYPLGGYLAEEIEQLRSLVALLRRAVRAQDPRLVGEVATTSARINQRRLPKQHFDYLENLVERAGALGLQVAHSGTVVGLLFDPQARAVEASIERAQALLSDVGVGPTWRFQTQGV